MTRTFVSPLDEQRERGAALSHIHGKHGTLCYVKSTLAWLIRLNAISLGGALFFFFFFNHKATYAPRLEPLLSLR